MSEEIKETITTEDIEVAEAAVANGEVIAAKDIPTPEEQMRRQKEQRKAVVEAFKQQWLRKYDLGNIDLVKELELINQKKSKLSRSRREAVQQFFLLFPIEPEVQDIKEEENE